MNVFVDFHHTALLRSLIMLFEDRLGGKVYRPIGMDWATNGFWKVYDHPATQAQFLSLDQGFRPIDGTPPLNTFAYPENPEQDVYYCADPENGTYNKAITLEKFREMDIDIIIATIPQHVEPFKRLIKDFKPNAKLIFQVGNNWNWEKLDVDNVMASTAPREVSRETNVIFYHQEFDINVFHRDFVFPERKIYSFVNNIEATLDWPLFQGYQKMLSDFEMKAFGGQCPDGVMNGTRNLANKMREARFIWHVKPGGDGFGHVVHNAFAVGRPIITRKSHYKDCLAESLMIDGQTCIDLDAHTIQENIRLIQEASQKEQWTRLSENAYNRFREIVDFSSEESKIREFISKLK